MTMRALGDTALDSSKGLSQHSRNEINIMLPKDLDKLPDLFVYYRSSYEGGPLRIQKGYEDNICFQKLKLAAHHRKKRVAKIVKVHPALRRRHLPFDDEIEEVLQLIGGLGLENSSTFGLEPGKIAFFKLPASELSEGRLGDSNDGAGGGVNAAGPPHEEPKEENTGKLKDTRYRRGRVVFSEDDGDVNDNIIFEDIETPVARSDTLTMRECVYKLKELKIKTDRDRETDWWCVLRDEVREHLRICLGYSKIQVGDRVLARIIEEGRGAASGTVTKVNANEEGDETYDVMLDDQLVEEESQDEAKQPEAGGSLKSNLTREQVQRDDKTDDGDNCSVLVGRDDGPRSEHISAIWIPLESDPAFHALKEGDYPGAVLAKVEFFRETEPSPPPKTLQSDIRAQKNPDDFSDTQKNPDEFFDTLKVNVLRATDLPAADINSLSDPYIKMQLRSEIKKTSPVFETLNPEYFDQLVFDLKKDEEGAQRDTVNLGWEKSKSDEWPMIGLQIWDYDKFGPDDLLGSSHVEMQKIPWKYCIDEDDEDEVPGTILRKNHDDSYDIQYDNGEDVSKYLEELIKDSCYLRSDVFWIAFDTQGGVLLSFELSSSKQPRGNDTRLARGSSSSGAGHRRHSLLLSQVKAATSEAAKKKDEVGMHECLPWNIPRMQAERKKDENKAKINLRPETIPIKIHIDALGLRDLQPLGTYGIGQTFVQFSIEGGAMASTVKSNPTSTPTAKNPNFGDNDADNQARTYVLEARLPIFPSDDAFIPSIAVSVYDQHFGSKFFTSILAQGSIDLLPYISYYRIHYFARCILERKPQKGYHRDMKYDRGSNKRSWVSCQDDDDLGEVLKNDPFRLPEMDIRIACAAGVTTLAEAAGQDGLLVLEEAFRFQHTSSRRQRGTNPFMEMKRPNLRRGKMRCKTANVRSSWLCFPRFKSRKLNSVTGGAKRMISHKRFRSRCKCATCYSSTKKIRNFRTQTAPAYLGSKFTANWKVLRAHISSFPLSEGSRI